MLLSARTEYNEYAPVPFWSWNNRLDKAEITDDCSAVERLGMSVKIVEGDEKNLKVTTPMDLKVAELLMEEM